MSIIRPIAVAFSLLLATLPAHAQTEDTTPAAEADLSLGQEVPGTPYVAGQHGDWEQRCVRAPEGQDDPCQIYQLLRDQDGNSVAEISIFPLPEGGQAVAGATIATPLETLLTQQITLSVDGGTAKRYPYNYCDAAGCYARVGFTASDLSALKRGAAATMRIVPVQRSDQAVLLTLSLSGFTAGYAALSGN